MIRRHDFPIPEGVVEVRDEYQLNLAHYELLHLKPKGTILFAKEKNEITFQFFATEDRAEGIYARLDGNVSPNVGRVLEYIQKYPRTEAFVTIVLLQFKFVFIASRVEWVRGVKEKTIRLAFPPKFLKMHRRRFIRIPFNESFPAELEFQTEHGLITRKLRDLSREGLRLRLHEEDKDTLKPGTKIKQATLKVLNRELKLGLILVSVYPNLQAGLRIIAISEDDKVWLKDFIRVLMKQILNLQDPPFDDEVEKDKVKDE